MRAVWWKSYFLPAPAEFKRAPYTHPATMVPFATTQAAELLGVSRAGQAIVNWGGQAMMLHLTSVDDDVAEALKTWVNGGSFDVLAAHLARSRAHDNHQPDRSARKRSGSPAESGRSEDQRADGTHGLQPDILKRSSAQPAVRAVRKLDGGKDSTSPSNSTPSSGARGLKLTVYAGKQRIKVLDAAQYARYKCAPGETKKLEIV